MRTVRSVARRPLPEHPKLRHVRADLRDPAAARALAGVDVLFHLGFALWAGGSDEQSEVNRGSTRAVAASGAGRIVLASSAAVYGAWPDNPLPIGEGHPPRPNRECAYAGHKLEAEAACLESAESVVLRISAVLGPSADPRVLRAARGYRLAVPAIRGARQALQFLDEEDAVEALLAAGRRGAPGVYNVAPPDWLGEEEVARVARSRVLRLPARVAIGAAEAARRARLAPFGADRAVFLTGPIALDPARAETELGWRARRGSRETLARALAA